jgi:hypothetical protein
MDTPPMQTGENFITNAILENLREIFLEILKYEENSHERKVLYRSFKNVVKTMPNDEAKNLVIEIQNEARKIMKN